MTTEHESDFRQLAVDSGLPTTEDEINAEFERVREDSELTITNANAFGPFWRFVKAALTTATKWLVDFIIMQVLPQAFLKTSSGAFVDIHAWSVNLTRKEARKAEGVIQFSRTNTAGVLVIPQDTVVLSAQIAGTTYRLFSVSEAQFNDGDATLDVPVIAEHTGADFNLAENYFTLLEEEIDGVDSVTNTADWLTVLGADVESDDDLKERSRNQIVANNSYHTDAVYTSIIASFEGVATDNVYFLHNAPRGPGTANAYILLETGVPSAEFVASIQSRIMDDGYHGHGDNLLVSAIPETSHNITATVWPDSNLSAGDIADLLLGVENFIRAAFRENANYSPTRTEPYSVFSFSKLSQELHREFVNLKNVAFDLSHIDSALDIPRIGVLTVAEHV